MSCTYLVVHVVDVTAVVWHKTHNMNKIFKA